MTKIITKLGALLILACAAGCGRPFDVNTPRGFVELAEQAPDYDYRATSPDGVVVAVRALDVEDRGTVAFWEEAVTIRLRDVGGYALLSKTDVESDDGTPGKRLTFGHDEDGKPYAYVVTLFRAQGRLFLLEAGGRKELVERHLPALDWQAKTFRARCGFPGAPVIASHTCNRW